MGAKRGPLTVGEIRTLKKPGRHSDGGGGLYLLIKPDGRRTWLFRYRDRVTQKHRDMGLGPLADVTLKKAREKAAAARATLLDGADPIDASRGSRNAAKLAKARAKTFGDCAESYIAAHRGSWRNAKHAAQWRSTLDTYAADLLPLPVGYIDTAAVLTALEPIWQEKTETATRVRQRIEAVLDWATARGYRAGENPARWRGHLQKLMPAPAKLKNVTHRAAMPYVDMPAFLKKLGDSPALSARSLLLQILTATRPGEAIGARWEEFDLKAGVWTIPGERMKAKRDHRAPLPPRLLTMLKNWPGGHAGLLFPGKGEAPMTTAAPLKVLKSLAPGLSAHGFRSTFRDWAADQTAYPRDVAEAALAHALKDKTEAAYRRSDLFEKRAKLMAEWERYCYCPPTKGSNITPIKRSHSG